MNIKDIKCKNKTIYYYKTKDFATIDIRHYFYFESNKENYIKSLLLNCYLLRTNEKYKTQKEINDKTKELYGLKINITNYSPGIKSLNCFEFKMVNPRVIEEDYFLDAINFYKDIILKPNFKDNKLDKEVFSQIKKELIDKEKNNIKDPNILNERLYYKNTFPKSIINSRIITDIKELEEIINNIKDIDIINFYNEIMNNYVTSIAFGNLLNEEISLIENSFDFKPSKFDFKYDIKETINNKDTEIVSKDTTQSYIYFTYDIKNFKKENKYLYEVLMIMLNNSNGPIYNTYRTKMGIMYSGYSITLFNFGGMFILVNIDKASKDKAIQGLKEIFDILHDEKELNKLLKFAKERIKETFISNSENVDSVINELESYVLKNDLSTEEKLKLVNKLTIKDIINQIDNLEYKSMYFYKGDKNEK